MDQRNENRGRDQNIFNQPGTVIVHPAAQLTRSRTEQQLLQIVKQEVESRLRQSLHNAVLINLDKEAQPEQVKRPWDAEIKIGSRPAEQIPENTSILEVFEQPEVGGKLLILGNPGSGKTTTLLDLAKALIGRAETEVDFPIPVLFNLSAWKEDKQQIRDWLIAELKQKYGIRQDIGQSWLKERHLLPLLDGLDEVKPERQETCVQAINQFLTGEDAPLYAVVCSRREEYGNYETSLQLNGAICLQALTLPQIQDYLMQVNRSELWELLNHDADLLELVQAPLFLSIVILAYPADSLDQWQQLNSTQERLQDLWDRYICRMFERQLRSNPYKTKEPSQKQARRWLVWLAQQMQRESQTEFLIEKMQPSCLVSNKQKRRYSYTFGFLFTLLNGIILVISMTVLAGIIMMFLGLSKGVLLGLLDLLIGLGGGLLIGLVILVVLTPLVLPFGFIFGFIVEYFGGLNNIQPIEAIKISSGHFSRQRFFEKFVLLFRTGMFYSLVNIISYIPSSIYYLLTKGFNSAATYLFTNMATGLLAYGLPFGLGTGVIFGFIYGFQAEVQIHVRPNQGIRNSVRNASISLTVVSGLLFLLISLLIRVFNIDSEGSESLSSTGKIFTVLFVYCLFVIPSIVVVAGGGFVLAQHMALRWILFRNQHIPWNYARFLDYASERLLIQRVGGRYRFIHKLLQDHFANM